MSAPIPSSPLPVRTFSAHSGDKGDFLLINGEIVGCRTGRFHRVLHDRWGIGQVLRGQAGCDAGVTVRFADAIRQVPSRTLRPLVPVTVLARMIEVARPEVTAWAVRKANERGTIQPDAVGSFAGHKVHYYDTARVPALIGLLSCDDPWNIGTLVMHSRYGAGKIVARGPQADPRTGVASRIVEFFSASSQLSVQVEQLRRLVPSHVIAKTVAANRKTFSRLAPRRGIFPDYTASEGRARELYDEGRIGEIRDKWTSPEPVCPWRPGAIVLDADGEIASIVSGNAQGQVLIRNLDSPVPARPVDLSTVRELISLRELARSESMSRYKLSRLLAAVGLKPVCRHGKTMYFDRGIVHPALQARISCERNGLTIHALAARTGVSEAILARKVRGGQIRTLGHHGTHYVDAAEAERVEQILRAMRSPASSLKSLGICEFQPRGRSGAEVVSWNLNRLLEIAEAASSDRRAILCGQVAWRCEGAGQKRLRSALDAWLPSLETALDAPRKAEILLTLLDRLPEKYSPYRIRLLLAACAPETWQSAEERIKTLAKQVAPDDLQALTRFRALLDQDLAELLKPERVSSLVGLADSSQDASRCPGDEYIEGAILVSVSDRRPAVGVIARIEQQCWDAVTRRWHKSLVVRFADGERRVCTWVRRAEGEQRRNQESLLILLRSAEALTLVELLQQRYGHASGSAPQGMIAIKAA